MTAAEALGATLRNLLPPPGWIWSLERAHDGLADPTKRYGIVKTNGGAGGDVVRLPLLSVDLVGLPSGDSGKTLEAAETVVTTLRESSGPVAIFEPGEPVPSLSAEGRPIHSVAVAATLIED